MGMGMKLSAKLMVATGGAITPHSHSLRPFGLAGRDAGRYRDYGACYCEIGRNHAAGAGRDRIGCVGRYVGCDGACGAGRERPDPARRCDRLSPCDPAALSQYLRLVGLRYHWSAGGQALHRHRRDERSGPLHRLLDQGQDRQSRAVDLDDQARRRLVSPAAGREPQCPDGSLCRQYRRAFDFGHGAGHRQGQTGRPRRDRHRIERSCQRPSAPCSRFPVAV